MKTKMVFLVVKKREDEASHLSLRFCSSGCLRRAFCSHAERSMPSSSSSACAIIATGKVRATAAAMTMIGPPQTDSVPQHSGGVVSP
jgi:hypothetical protein